MSPEVWCKLVLPAVLTSAGCRVSGTDKASSVAVGPIQCTSCLKVLVGLLHGSMADTVQPHLQVFRVVVIVVVAVLLQLFDFSCY